MNRKMIPAVLVTAASFAFAASVRAESEDPCAAMLQHAEQAVKHGKQGHPDTLLEHAGAMLKGAKACKKKGALKPSAMDHLDEAISHQESTLDHGGAGHDDIALKHAESALKHANEAVKAAGM